MPNLNNVYVDKLLFSHHQYHCSRCSFGAKSQRPILTHTCRKPNARSRLIPRLTSHQMSEILMDQQMTNGSDSDGLLTGETDKTDPGSLGGLEKPTLQEIGEQQCMEYVLTGEVTDLAAHGLDDTEQMVDDTATPTATPIATPTAVPTAVPTATPSASLTSTFTSHKRSVNVYSIEMLKITYSEIIYLF